MDRRAEGALLAMGIALLTAVLAYALAFLSGQLRSGPDRAAVREYVWENIAELTCAVIREEEALVSDRELIRPAVAEGTRLAAGEAAAIACDSAGEFMRAALLLRLRRELQALECSSSAPAPREVLLRDRARLSAALVRGDFEGAGAAGLDLALGLLPQAADPHRARALREEIGALEAAGAAGFLLTAPAGAVWSAYTDGWEALSPARLRELDADTLRAVLRAPVPAPSGAGKLVTGGAWLLAALTDTGTGALFPPGDVFELRTEAGVFTGEVILLRTDGAEAIVVFRCREGADEVLRPRVLDVRAVLGRTEGLLLPEEALRREDGGVFVYRIADGLLIRCEVTLLASLPDGALVRSETLRPGDSVLPGDPGDSAVPVL